MINVSTDPQTNEPEYQLRQIEVNCGSIASAGCIERLATLHRRVLEKSGYSKRAIDNALPENRSGTALALTIFKAWEQLKDPQAILVFLLLAMPGMVERFFPDPSEAQMVADIRNTFAKLWGLENDDEKTRAVIEDAIAHPERYVLKPNKEGGGVNFWGQDIVDKLETFTPKLFGLSIQTSHNNRSEQPETAKAHRG
uniref:Glutathione synthetase n=1 Tax=Globodera pallida TaxID=36090 RepID=A0A183CFF0_GLOPA